MTPERWQQIKKVLEAALGQNEEMRRSYLDATCANDPALREEVDSFLTSTSTGPLEDFLEQPAIGRPPALSDDELTTTGGEPTGERSDVCPLELAPYTKLLVFTRTSEYRLTVVSPLDLDVLVQGGRRFPRTTRARLLRQHTIARGEVLRLQVGRRKVVTTPVVKIEVLPSTQAFPD